MRPHERPTAPTDRRAHPPALKPTTRGHAKCTNLKAAAAVLATLTGQPAPALNLTATFDAAASEYPSFDNDASRLISLFNYAVPYYEDIFPDAATIPFRYYYEDLPGPQLGFAAIVSDSETGEILDRFIRIDTTTPGGATRNWFIDSTPADDSEFGMGQILWRDPNNEPTDWYNDFIGTTPQTFEVAYTGSAIDDDLDDTKDMLTAVLHEIGHYLLGASPGGGEFPIPSNFIFSTPLSVETANTNANDTPDDNADIGHLESVSAMMNPGLPNGTRNRPSHTDLFAMAGNLGHNDIDVPRREFYGGSDYNNDANWSGDRTPDSNDDAFIRAAQGASTTITATLTESDTVRNLTVAEAANFRTDDYIYLIGEDLTLTGTDTDVFIDPGGFIAAEQVTVADNAELRINAGQLNADDITIDDTAHLIGNGTVNLDHEFAELDNNGRIAANGDATLTFNSDNTLALDLDGSGGSGTVEAINGNLVFNSSLTDAFSTTMTVGPGRTIELNGGAAFNGSALLLLDGSAEGDATVHATNITMQNNSRIRAAGPGVVDAFLTLQGNSQAEGASVSSSIQFDGTLNLQGGNVVGDGLAVFNGDINVIQNAFFSITAVDLDGDLGNNQITINPNRELEITGIAVETGSGDGYDGTIHVNSGTLTIHPNWRLDGDLNLNETDLTDPHLAGPGDLTIHTTGHLTTTGDTEIDARLTVNGQLDVGQFGEPAGITEVDNLIEFNDTAVVNIETGSFLDLNAHTTYRGGTHTGFGTLRWNADVTIADDTAISVLNLDFDGDDGTTTTTINPARTLTINASTLDTNPASPMDGTVNINSGHLHVLPAWELNGQINMAEIGFAVTTPTLSGTFGLTLNNGAEINISGDAEINTDIVSNGHIFTEQGITTVHGAITFNPSSTTTTFTPTFGFDEGNTIDLRGPTTYNAGTFLGNGILRQNEDATVVAPTTINVGRFDADGNSPSPVAINVDADLTINAEQLDEVEGAGRLDFNRHDGFFNVASGAALTVNLPTRQFWVAARSVTLGSAGPEPAQLNGSEVWFGNSQTGAVNVTAHHLAQINATSHFLSDVIVVVPLFGIDRLEINAPTTFSGGVYDGAGMLAVNHTATINSDTTFSTTQIDLDGSSNGDHLLLLRPDARLTIENAIAIDDDASHDDPIELRENAQLVVNTLGPWTLGPAGSLLLNQAHPSNISVSGQNLTSSGLIHGNGNFGIDLSNDGTIRPGLSTGHILVRFNYGQTTDGHLHLEIAGTAPATEHDQLEVLGNARLAGTVQAQLLDPYTPDYGDRFTVLTAAAVINTFDTHVGLLIDTSLALAPIYAPDNLTLRASVPGDLNFDDAVTVADLSAFALFFNTTQPFYAPDTDTNSWQLGDFNTDGAVTVADLSLLALNFGFGVFADGTTTPATPLSFAAAANLAGIDLVAIPEPASAALWALASFYTTLGRPHRSDSSRESQTRPLASQEKSPPNP